jgi:hypothetical protein
VICTVGLVYITRKLKTKTEILVMTSPLVLRLLSCAVLLTAFADAQATSSVALTPSQNPSNFGLVVTLTAAVTPGATGKVTFYDGVNVLGTSTIAASQATFTSVLLPSGTRYLRAHYEGDSTYAPSNSAVVTQTVMAQPSLGLMAPVTYTAAYPQSATVTDVNGDGKPDLIVSDTHGSPGAGIWLGNGDGTFVTTYLSSVEYTNSTAAADFNGDGKQDLALVSFGTSTLVVVLGNGDGTFGAPMTYPYGLTSIDPVVAVGDFNGDGIPDIALSFLDAVGVLLGNGDGTFKSMVKYATTNAYMVALADFNGDGNTDVAVGGETALNFSILLGNGDGTFQPSVTYTAPSYTTRIAIDDFNGDGKADLVMGDITSNSIYVYLGNGDGTFQTPVGYPIGYGAGGVATGDINGDGKIDLIESDYTGVGVFLGNGDGTFQSVMHFAIPSNSPGFLVVSDFNADSKTDVATLTGISQLSVMLGGAGVDLSISLAPGPGFTRGQVGATYTLTVTDLGTIATSGSVSVVDTLPPGFTATGISGAGWSCVLATLTCTHSDSLAGGAAYPSITITVNISPSITGNAIDTATVSGGGDQNPSGSTTPSSVFIRTLPAVTLTSSTNPSALGHAVTLTATVTSGATGEVTFYDGINVLGSGTMAAGQATFTTRLLPSSAQSLLAIYSGDANFGPNTSAAYVQTVNAVADDALLPPTNYTVDADPSAEVLGDLNGDGIPDLVTVNMEGGDVSVLLGNGDGTFRSAVNYPTGCAPLDLVLADFNRDGNQDLAVTGENGFCVLLGNGDGSFQPPITHSGSMFGGLAVIDMNRDGIPDLLAESNDVGVSVFLGNGDGTFQPSVTTDISGVMFWAVLDANGDGVPDLASMTSDYGAPVNVWLGNTNGTFQAPTSSTVENDYPMAMAAGDFNGDGKTDLAVLYLASVAALLGNGDGTFQAPIQSGAAPPGYAVAAGDVNGDGKLDLVYAGYGEDILTVALGNGDGTFQPGANTSSEGTGNPLIGDFNGDGKPDVAISDHYSNTLSVSLGAQLSGLFIASTHTGSFVAGQIGATYLLIVTDPEFTPSSGTVTVTDTLPAGLTATAISGSGWSCVLPTLTCTRSDTLYPGTNYPPITLTVNVSSSMELPTVTNLASVSTSAGTTVGMDPTTIILPVEISLNVTPGSSLLDQVVTMTATVGPGDTGTVLFLDGMDALGVSAISAGQAAFTTSLLEAGVHQLRAFYSENAVHAGFSTITSFTVSAAPASTFAPVLNDATGSQPTGIAVGDFNNDGKADLVTANSGANTVSVLLGNGDGTFAAHVDYTVGGTPVAVAVGEFNGDGYPDLAVINQAGSTFSILLGNGDGTFRTATSSPAGNSPSSIAVGDFNRDGIEDLAVGSASGTTLNVFFGNGDGSFQSPVLSLFDVGTNLLVQDLNGDGNADLLVGSGYFYALLGNGDGTFAESPWVGFGSGGLAVGDLNGDGKADVVFPTGASPSLAVELGNGDGTFSGSQTFPTSFNPSSLAIADVNGDGKLDVIGASSSSSSVIVLLGNGDGTLQSPLSYGVGSPSAGMTVGNFNGDDRTDLAVTHGSASNGMSILLGQVGALQFYPIAPCRLVDTRGAAAGFIGVTPFDGPSIPTGGTITIPLQAASQTSTSAPAPCGVIPSSAQAYSFNLTVIPQAGDPVDYVSLWPAGSPQPFVSTLDDPEGLIVANAAIVPAGASSGGISVYNHGPATTDVIIDMNGYFAPPGAGALEFYPVAPCRLVDTRGAAAGFNGIDPFAGPSILAGGTLTIPVQSSTEAGADTTPAPCGVIPSTAQAYSFNLTVVPQAGGPVDYVSLWPAGSTQPFVSTLDDPEGLIVANAAIVPAGTSNGGVSVYNHGPATTDVVIDMNGYFAPPTTALQFYPVAPCRLVDTRGAAAGFNGIEPFSGPSIPAGGTLTIPVQSATEASTNTTPAPCGVIPSTAQAYSINVTVVPAEGGPVDYVSLWPAGSTRPFVSTLDDPEGLIVANAAIVPAGAPSGGVSVYNHGPSATDVVIDMNGYFAP